MPYKYISKGITLKLDSKACIGCGLCEIVCSQRVFEVIDKKAQIKYIDKCIECGACMSNCPVNAIKVKAGAGCAIAVLGGGDCC